MLPTRLPRRPDGGQDDATDSGQVPRLSIIIVNWNTKDLLRDCLLSIRNTTSDPIEILVVDNCSTDGSQDFVRSEFPTVRLVANTENVGFARANNQAIPLCRAPYILLLNSDTVMLRGTLEGLLKFMDDHPRAAASGPRLIDREGTPQIMVAGYLPTLATVFSYFFFLSRLWPRVFPGLSLNPGPPSGPPRRVEWVTGACLLVRRDVCLTIGGLPESYFMYAEDIDFCQRIVRAGHEIYTVPEVEVVHICGGSGRESPLEESTRWVTNLHRLFARDHSKAATAVFDLIYGTGLAIRMILSFVRSLAPSSSHHRRKARVMAASSRRAFGLAARALLGSESRDSEKA